MITNYLFLASVKPGAQKIDYQSSIYLSHIYFQLFTTACFIDIIFYVYTDVNYLHDHLRAVLK
jgi:hypothetical protein